MKTLISITVAFLLGAILFVSYGLGTEEGVKIGYVDIDKVFAAYDKSEGISKLVKAEREKANKEKARMGREIEDEQKKLEEGSGVTEKEKGEIRKGIDKKIEGLIEFERASKQKEHEPVRKALEQIYKAVEIVGEREGFDIIIEKREGVFGKTVLFAKKSLSLSDSIIKELQKK